MFSFHCMQFSTYIRSGACRQETEANNPITCVSVSAMIYFEGTCHLVWIIGNLEVKQRWLNTIFNTSLTCHDISQHSCASEPALHGSPCPAGSKKHFSSPPERFSCARIQPLVPQHTLRSVHSRLNFPTLEAVSEDLELQHTKSR